MFAMSEKKRFRAYSCTVLAEILQKDRILDSTSFSVTLAIANCEIVLCIPKKMLSAVSSKSPPERGHSTLHVVLERKKADILQGNKGTRLKG